MVDISSCISHFDLAGGMGGGGCRVILVILAANISSINNPSMSSSNILANCFDTKGPLYEWHKLGCTSADIFSVSYLIDKPKLSKSKSRSYSHAPCKPESQGFCFQLCSSQSCISLVFCLFLYFLVLWFFPQQLKCQGGGFVHFLFV